MPVFIVAAAGVFGGAKAAGYASGSIAVVYAFIFWVYQESVPNLNLTEDQQKAARQWCWPLLVGGVILLVGSSCLL